MDISTIYKFNKLIKSHNDETSDTKKKSISKNITKHVLNLKKNNKDRTKILNSYRKWLKNNNTAKSVQMGGGDEIYKNIISKLEALGKNAITFTETITNLQNIFNNPSTSKDYNVLLTNLKNSGYDNKVPDIMQLFELFNEKNLLGNIIQNYYAIFNNDSIKNLLTTQKYNNTKQTGFYVKDNNFNDVIFSKIATGTFYEQKPNKASKGFYNAWNVSATPPQKPVAAAIGTAPAPVAAPAQAPAAIGTAPAPVAIGTAQAPVAIGTVPAPVAIGTAPASVAIGTAQAPAAIGTAQAPAAIGTAPVAATIGTAPGAAAKGRAPGAAAKGRAPLATSTIGKSPSTIVAPGARALFPGAKPTSPAPGSIGAKPTSPAPGSPVARAAASTLGTAPALTTPAATIGTTPTAPAQTQAKKKTLKTPLQLFPSTSPAQSTAQSTAQSPAQAPAQAPAPGSI